MRCKNVMFARNTSDEWEKTKKMSDYTQMSKQSSDEDVLNDPMWAENAVFVVSWELNMNILKEKYLCWKIEWWENGIWRYLHSHVKKREVLEWWRTKRFDSKISRQTKLSVRKTPMDRYYEILWISQNIG